MTPARAVARCVLAFVLLACQGEAGAPPDGHGGAGQTSGAGQGGRGGTAAAGTSGGAGSTGGAGAAGSTSDAGTAAGSGGAGAGGSSSAGGNGGGGPGAGAGGAGPASRDPWLWPFAADSIWNQPIGSAAKFVPANLKPAANVGVDIQILLKLSASDPARHVLGSTTFGPGRCAGTEDIGITLNVPDDWIVPDAGMSPYGNTPNSNFAFLQPDGATVFEGNLVARCVKGGPVYLPTFLKYPNNQARQPVTGDGLHGGGQGASHMSALGGTIRKGELTGAAPLRHAVKVNPFAKPYLFYSSQIPGYRWPATAADSYANGNYSGTNPSLVMGSLLAIPPGATPESLGLTTEPAKILFGALRGFGVYFSEDAAWDTWDLVVERDAELEFQTKWGFSMSSATWKAEVNRLMGALSIVDNNGPTSIGGGGTPTAPTAPPFR